MIHLSSEKIYHLAELVTRELAFREEDAADMGHIGQCEQCYRRLRSAMALMDVLDNPEYALRTNVYAASQPRKRARICLTVDRCCPFLEPCETEKGNWPFAVRTAVAVHGGMAVQCPSLRMEDPENSENAVAYDAQRELLEISLAAGDGEQPRCTLVQGDREMPVELQRQGGSFRARIEGLEEGSYYIVLEK